MASDTKIRTGTKQKVYPFDFMIIIYCLLMIVMILFFGRPLGDYIDEIAFYIGITVLTLIIIRYVDESGGRWAALVRIAYPAFLFAFFYRVTGGLMSLIFDQFYDWQVVTFEKALFSVNPTIYIDSHLLSTALNEIFSFSYFSYYPMLPIFLIILYFRRDYDIMKEFFAASCLTFFASYILFSLYPVEGPRWYFAGEYLNHVDGPLFRKVVQFIIDKGAVRGGAMPSSHTGVAIVVLMFCFRYFRLYAWLLLPIVIGLAIGTVWGRFHYVSDLIIGGGMGVLATLLVWRYHTHWLNKLRYVKKSKTGEIEIVS